MARVSDVLAPPREGLEQRNTQPELQELAVCPSCHGGLTHSPTGIRCETCARTFALVDGIPILLIDPDTAGHDELEHLHSSRQKRQQASYFDREEAAEFEIMRPHGSPALYDWLIQEKFRRSIAGLTSSLPGGTALIVCGGSGMDAEFLARAGARVIVSDIAIGAIQRARERSRRFGFPVTPIVADVERLPFADGTVDLVYVHDGLHHLDQPLVGLAEMARVAARAISVNEPARAAITAAAVRLGLSSNQEISGNRVARMSREEIAAALRCHGFRIVHSERYGMYYRHEPGALFRAMSSRAVFPIVKTGYQLLNGVAGHLGNKLTVQAVRDSIPETTRSSTLRTSSTTGLEEIRHAVGSGWVDAITVDSPESAAALARIVEAGRKMGRTVQVSGQLSPADLPPPTATERWIRKNLRGHPFWVLTQPQPPWWQLGVKRLIDMVVASTLLVLLSPLLFACATAVRLSSPGPILYPWRVLGRNGRPFTGYKFRTMVQEADTMRSELRRHNEMVGPVFKMTEDPRITAVGRWLRKYSLDELPQLWSVLKGDMSLVGPRPVFREEYQQFELWQMRKLSVTPGLTCLWQVRGRNAIADFDEWARLDLQYIDQWSLGLDVKILARTVLAVVGGTGR